MRLGNPLLFRDDDDLVPGDKWRPTIRKNISDCDTFVLFWCWHSDKSKSVQDEWKQALKERKRIVPVLMDATRVPARLAEHHWIDLSRELRHRHQKRYAFKRYGWTARPSEQYVEPTFLAGLKLRVELFRLLTRE